MKKETGFTLIEMLISVAIISIFSVGLLALQAVISKNQVTVVDNFTSIDDANKIVDSIVKELRSARSADNGAFAFEVMDDYEIVFYSDIDFDEQSERVRYTLVNNQLIKGIIEPDGQPVEYPQESEVEKILSSNIRNGETVMFSYYNSDWPEDDQYNPLSQGHRLSDTKTIKVSCIINPKDDDTKSNYFIESSAQLRLFKESD